MYRPIQMLGTVYDCVNSIELDPPRLEIVAQTEEKDWNTVGTSAFSTTFCKLNVKLFDQNIYFYIYKYLTKIPETLETELNFVPP